MCSDDKTLIRMQCQDERGKIIGIVSSILIPQKTMKAGEKVTLKNGESVKLPDNYVEKPDTVIIVDQNNNLVFHDNGDGTVSGISVSLFGFEGRKPKRKAS